MEQLKSQDNFLANRVKSPEDVSKLPKLNRFNVRTLERDQDDLTPERRSRISNCVSQSSFHKMTSLTKRGGALFNPVPKQVITQEDLVSQTSRSFLAKRPN